MKLAEKIKYCSPHDVEIVDKITDKSYFCVKFK